jgi:histidinol-phosphate aminotransferase
VRHPFNVNLVAQAAALAALDDHEHLDRSIRCNHEGMFQLLAGIARLGLASIESAGNFLAVDTGRSAVDVYNALLREGVIVRPVANYGMPQHLRVTIGSTDENARFLVALEKVLT